MDLNECALQLSSVSKTFSAGPVRVTALDRINLTIKPGEFVTLLGPSGCGKTTLLRIIAGLAKPSSGKLEVGVGQDGKLHKMSFVFQNINLLPWRTVQRNVELGLEGAERVGKRERKERSMEALQRVMLSAFADAPPHTLSGGMQQRIGLARALVVDPQILLMDEPYSALDNFNREILQEELARLWEDTRPTVVFVTHDIDEAIFLSTRIVIMASNPGRVVKEMEVAIPERRWEYDVRSEPEAIALRREIVGLIRSSDHWLEKGKEIGN